MSAVITLPPKDREREIERLVRAARDFRPGQPVNVKFTIARPERTNPQCRYLWGVAYKMLSEHTGYEPEEIAEYLCGNYFGWRTHKKPGGRSEERPIRTTTTDAEGNRDVLSGDDFWAYVEWVQRVAARQGVVIPDPEGC
jgi:hypothetical protein